MPKPAVDLGVSSRPGIITDAAPQIESRPAVWFGDYVAQKVGSPKWVVARRTPRLEGRGHEAFLSPAKFRALVASFHVDFPTEARDYFGAAS